MKVEDRTDQAKLLQETHDKLSKAFIEALEELNMPADALHRSVLLTFLLSRAAMVAHSCGMQEDILLSTVSAMYRSDPSLLAPIPDDSEPSGAN